MFSKILLGFLVWGAAAGTPAAVTSARGAIRAPEALAIRAVPPAESISSHGRARLDAGAVVEVRWSELPKSVDEIELLLSVDGGRTYAVRLTDELDPTGGSFLWEVPRLTTDRAHLAIRMGGGGGGREVIAATSSEFEISADPSAATVRLRWHAGEIWMRSDGELDRPEPVPGRGLSGDSEGMRALQGSPDAAEIPPRAIERSVILLRSRSRSCTARPRRGRPTGPPRLFSQAIPQRI